MENNKISQPKKGGFNWGHGLLVALGGFMVFILSLIFYFTNTMQNSELITDNYYQEEMTYQKVIDATKRAETLSQKPNVNVQRDGLKISFPQDINNTNAKFNFYLYRTDDKNLDVKKDFQLEQDNTYLIPKEVLVHGSYILKLMWQKQNENYQINYDILWTQD